jgi:3-(3-hydroxy-phenyl)propionate hydroxylase
MAAIVQDGADPAILDTYQPERDPHVRSVIGAAVGAGRYICELDPAKAATRDAQFRAAAKQAAPQTAADLIPAIQSGIVLTGTPGAGERFIQPQIGSQMLDDAIGGGWRLFSDALLPQHDCAGVTLVNTITLADRGAVNAWLATHAVQAVLVRPDHYVFGTGAADALLASRSTALGLAHTLTMEVA